MNTQLLACAAEHVDGFFDQGIEVGGLGVVFSGPGESQQLTGEPGCAAHMVDDALQVIHLT